MKKNIFFLLILGIVCWTHQAVADSVCLENGNAIEGIITQDTDKTLEMEVFLNAKITFTKQDIAFIKKWDEQENQALRERWLKDKQAREQAELQRQQFEAQQRAKGLVEYEGRWISQPEKESLQNRQYVDTVLREKLERTEVVDSARKNRTDVARALLAAIKWESRQSEHFIIYYEDVLQSKIVADRAEYYYEKIAYDLNCEKTIHWPQKCEVFIIPSKEKWEEYMQGLISRLDHVGGFVPRSGEKEIYLCSLSLPYLSVTFPHELTHLMFKEFVQGEYIPLWLNEGLAIYESGLIGYADQLLRDKVKEAKHLPIKQMMQLRDYPQDKEEMELYYAQAEKTVEFLITQHGRKRFSEFCRLLAGGQNFTKALDVVYGDKYYSEDEFNRAWIRYVLK